MFVAFSEKLNFNYTYYKNSISSVAQSFYSYCLLLGSTTCALNYFTCEIDNVLNWHKITSFLKEWRLFPEVYNTVMSENEI